MKQEQTEDRTAPTEEETLIRISSQSPQFSSGCFPLPGHHGDNVREEENNIERTAD